MPDPDRRPDPIPRRRWRDAGQAFLPGGGRLAQGGSQRYGARMMVRLLALLLLAFAAACGQAPRLPAPPASEAERIVVLGVPNARFWPDLSPGPMVEEARLMAARRRAAGTEGRADFLAISGGGDNGAFGAGLMVGWTESGQRPVFDVVTGVSAGALIAPLAFLGPQHDDTLREVFTPSSRSDVVSFSQAASRLFFGDGLLDSAPLFALVQRHVDQATLDAIAREYARGRMLLIGTVNLDQQRPVVWNIGAIAASGHPQALALFRSILMASAAIPGAFPPVLIDVELDGRRFQEMHVDGGAAAQVFLYPPSISFRRDPRAQRTVWVIRHDRLDPDWQTVQRDVLSITRRSVMTMIHFAGMNDVVRLHALAQRDGMAFRLASIDPGFTGVRGLGFNPEYMRRLFDHGRARGRSGAAWVTAPPGLERTMTIAVP